MLRPKQDPKYFRAYRLKRYYNMTEEDYQTLLDKQRGGCAICGRTPQRRLHVDHCHLTGRVRGLLCYNCNRMLGDAHDKISLLAKAANYLCGA